MDAAPNQLSSPCAVTAAGDGQQLWRGDLLHQGPHTIETFGGGFRWTQAGDPTPSECADKLACFSTDSVLLDIGTRACVRTNGGRVVLLRVLKVNSDSYVVNATVWAAP